MRPPTQETCHIGKWLCRTLLLVLLAEGQTMQIGGTDLTITAKAIRDLTAEGCLGGPIGCRDYVEAEVTRGKVSQQITLYTPQTEVQREQNVHRAKVFGY